MRRPFAPFRPARRPGRVADKDSRFRITNEITDFGRGIGSVQRQKYATGTDRAEIEHQGIGRLFHLDSNPVSRFDTQFLEGTGILRRPREHVRVGYLPAVQCFEKDLGPIRYEGGQGVKEMVHHRSVPKWRAIRKDVFDTSGAQF